MSVNGCCSGPKQCSLAWVFREVSRWLRRFQRQHLLESQMETCEVTAEYLFKGQSYNLWKNKTSPKDVLKDQFELLGKHQIFVYKYHMIINKSQYILTARNNFLSTFQRHNVNLLIVMISNKCKQFLRSQTWPYNTVAYQLGSRFAIFGFIEKSWKLHSNVYNVSKYLYV